MAIGRSMWLAFFSCAVALTVAARGATSIVGDPNNPAGLPLAMHDAHASGVADITIAPGTYKIASQGDRDTIILDRWNNCNIHGNGVTLIFEELQHRPVSFRQCQNVIWDGGTLRFVRPAFTQGRIQSLGHDTAGDYCDWTIDTGYPTNVEPAKSTFNTVDPTTRVLKVATGDWTPRSCQLLSPGAFRLYLRTKEMPGFSAKDWLVTRAPAGNAIMHLDGCQGCTLQNVVMQNGGFATVFETGGMGGNHFLKCNIQPGPRPSGASEDQLVGCGADGVHSVGTTVGPDLEDCVFSGVFLDDCIAIHGSFSRVIQSDGNTIILAHGQHKPVVGDSLRISDTHGFFAQALCTAIDELPSHDLRITLDQKLDVPIDHLQDTNPKLGTKANDPNRCGRGYKIMRCRLGDTRSRGILVKADDGLIADCTIHGCGMSGISVGPEFWWGEANYCWNVTLANNTFQQCNKQNSEQASIWIHGDGAMGNRKIAIRSNLFDTCFGRWQLRIEDADGADIASNHFENPFSIDPHQPGNIVWIDRSRNINLLGNTVTNQGKFAGKPVGNSKNVPADTIVNNNQTGVVVQAH